MKKSKILLGALLVVVGAGAVMMSSNSLFQGRIFQKVLDIPFTVQLNSDKISTTDMGYDDKDLIKTNEGDEIIFTRTIKSRTTYNMGWTWNFDSKHLDCAAYPEFDSDSLKCTVLSSDKSSVSYTADVEFPNGLKKIVTSNLIWVDSQKVDTNCTYTLENFDPNKKAIAKYGEKVDFEWNGPGCSQYEFSQYLLCFENLENLNEHACIGVPDSNHHTLTSEDWAFIDSELKTKYSKYNTATQWYVQSRFGDAISGEILQSEPWKFSYSTFRRSNK